MRKREIIKNVSSSWFSLGVNILVGIFLSPFILHRLGNFVYGAWVLVFSVTGYYGLFDLGVRSSIIRYVSTYTATNDIEGLSRLINTSLAGYSAIGIIALLVTGIVSIYVDSVFRVPASFVATARTLFLIVGASVAFGFPTGVFGGILEGLGRFYIVNVTNLASSVLRAVLIVVALNHGYGVLTLALITVAMPFLSSIARAAIVLHSLPLRFGWKYVDRSSLREIAQYSSVSFILMISHKLRFKTDELVLSAMLSVSAVTFFSIGDRLVDYTIEVVTDLSQIFVPMSGASDAKGDKGQLQRIFVAGNRACALVVLPITATLIILGKSVITVWVGANYVAAGYPIMLTLLIPTTFTLAQSASTRILYGMAKHRSLAWVTSIEGIANLALSIIMIRPFGVLGDAMGTAIPLLCTGLFFMPRHLCRVLNVRLGTFLREAYVLPILLCLPTISALLLLRQWFTAKHYWQLALQIILGLVPYGIGVAWAIWSGRIFKTRQLSSHAELNPVDAALIDTYNESP